MSQEVIWENIDDKDRGLTSGVLDGERHVTRKNCLSRHEKQTSKRIDCLESIDDDDLAAIAEAQKIGLLASIGIFTKQDSDGGINSKFINVAAHDISSKFEESPADFYGTEDSNDATSEQSSSRFESIIQSLKDIW